MFVLVLLTHQPVHHWFLSQHCYHCYRNGSAAPGFPPPHICDPGTSPSLTSSLHHHPALPQAFAHTHACTRTAGDSTYGRMQLMEHPGWRADIKMDGRGDRPEIQRWQVYLFVKEEAIKTRMGFRETQWLFYDG